MTSTPTEHTHTSQDILDETFMQKALDHFNAVDERNVKRSFDQTLPCDDDNDNDSDADATHKKFCPYPSNNAFDTCDVSQSSTKHMEATSNQKENIVQVFAKKDEKVEDETKFSIVQNKSDSSVAFFDDMFSRREILQAISDSIDGSDNHLFIGEVNWQKLLHGDMLAFEIGEYRFEDQDMTDMDKAAKVSAMVLDLNIIRKKSIVAKFAKDGGQSEDMEKNRYIQKDQSFAAHQQECFANTLESLATLYGQSLNEIEDSVLAFARAKKLSFEQIVYKCGELYGSKNVSKNHSQNALIDLFLKESRRLLSIDADKKSLYGIDFVSFLEQNLYTTEYPACDAWISAIDRRIKKQIRERYDAFDGVYAGEEVAENIEFVMELLEVVLKRVKLESFLDYKMTEIGPQIDLVKWIRIHPSSFDYNDDEIQQLYTNK